ncbi:nucleoporin 88-like [Branchiostoma floridae x Branchiostoma japonicum]
MAASEAKSWRNVLNDHPLFLHLRRGESDGKSNRTEARGLVVVQDGDIYAWNGRNSTLVTANLKTLLRDEAEVEKRPLKFQTLLCTDPPLSDVHHVKFSLTGNHVALWGPGGVSIMEVPRRWGKHAEFEGGKDKVNCRSYPVAERLFATQSSLQLLQIDWHPGSPSDTHLVILTSDNVLRIYDIEKPDSPYQSFQLGEYADSFSLHSTSSATFNQALGETAVSFTFAPPVDVPVQEKMKWKSDQAKKTETMYPVFVLRGNEDVYYLLTSLEQKSPKVSLQGPLTMHPPADDNYGIDACSILCLPCNPPLVVIATTTGRLYHCIVLQGEEEDDDRRSEVSWTGSDVSTRDAQDMPEPSLYVYESVELELSLGGTPDDIDSYPDYQADNCAIRLHPDPNSDGRYHCSHAMGVHSVALPWINKLHRFSQSDEEDKDSLLELSRDQPCIVEHLVCTRPVPSSPPAPILGLTVVGDQLLGPTLLCLTSDVTCIALPLLTHYANPPPPTLSSLPSQPVTSPLRKLHSKPFDQHIRDILRRDASNPILKSIPKSSQPSDQECFQLLTRATQVFRDEYIKKQYQAREEVEKRVDLLKEQKAQQQTDLDTLREDRKSLTETAEKLAEKYEEANEKQQEYLRRVENVLKNLQARLPVLSDAEVSMKKELESLQEKLKHLKNSTQQVKTKWDYQKRQVTQQARQSSSPALSQSQSKHMKELLKQEGDKIGELVKQVNSLKLHCGV